MYFCGSGGPYVRTAPALRGTTGVAFQVALEAAMRECVAKVSADKLAPIPGDPEALGAKVVAPASAAFSGRALSDDVRPAADPANATKFLNGQPIEADRSQLAGVVTFLRGDPQCGGKLGARFGPSGAGRSCRVISDGSALMLQDVSGDAGDMLTVPFATMHPDASTPPPPTPSGEL